MGCDVLRTRSSDAVAGANATSGVGYSENRPATRPGSLRRDLAGTSAVGPGDRRTEVPANFVRRIPDAAIRVRVMRPDPPGTTESDAPQT